MTTTTLYAVDCSQYPGQDYLRTADDQIALYPTRKEAEEVVSVLGGSVVSWYGRPRDGFCKVV